MLEVRARHRLGDFILDIAFEGPPDGVTVLFGTSGAGKSATLSAIAGTLRGGTTRIAIGTRVLTDTAARIHVPPEKRRIGIVHQDARLFPHMPVRANLLYGWRRADGDKRIGIDAVVDVLGIAHLLDRRTAELSGGERQRVAIGRALLSQPDLLLLDEPVSALDMSRRAEILGFIADLKTSFRMPMIYVTHDHGEARMLGDHIVRLDAGRVTAQGTSHAILPDKTLVAVVVAHDGEDTIVRLDDRMIRLPRLDATLGSRVRIDW